MSFIFLDCFIVENLSTPTKKQCSTDIRIKEEKKVAVKQEQNWGPGFFFFNPINSYPAVPSNNTQSISNIQQQQMVREIT